MPLCKVLHAVPLTPACPAPPAPWPSPWRSYAAVRELARLSATGRGPFRLASLKGTAQENFCGSVPCAFWHPGHSCLSHVPAYWPGAYLRALPV